ncbi:GntR family transcriptional regulator [Paenibacillus naphthalenovorans]|uniref:GntR family transcriptional regulator n=1 Tax=Paenibacillus naphthalenovorans TaxID=162209 RepID=UPI003D2E0434
MIHQHNRLPLYIQLKEWIITQIETEKFKSGEKIPTEHRLSEMHEISRPTVRQALAELVQEGYLEKRRGLGTYVARPMFTGKASILRTFGEDMEMIGLNHSAKMISKKQYNASVPLANELNIEPDSPVFEIVRLRLANGTPLAIRTSIIPKAFDPELMNKDLENYGLYEMLAKSNHFPSYSKQKFQAVAATKEEAELLLVKAGTPLMLWKGVVYTTNNQPIEKVKIVYLGSHFSFEIDQIRLESNVHFTNIPANNE